MPPAEYFVFGIPIPKPISLRLRQIAYWVRCWQQTKSLLASLPCDSLLVLDGLEQLNPIACRRLANLARRRQVSVLATSHCEVTGYVEIFRTDVSKKLVFDLAKDLLQNSSPAAAKYVWSELKSRRIDQTTNVRDLWFDLYEYANPVEAPLPTDLVRRSEPKQGVESSTCEV